MKYLTIVNNEQYEIEIQKDGSLLVNGEQREVDFLSLGPSLYSLLMNDQSWQIVIDEDGGRKAVMMRGRMYEAQVLDERALLMTQRKGGLGVVSGEVRSPMPGLIVAVPVEVGQSVQQGETIAILESMKMQNELKSMIDGVVQSIHCEAGQTIDKGAVLVIVAAEE